MAGTVLAPAESDWGSPKIDPRTGRPLGDHGSASAAIEFALDGSNHDHDAYNALEFLSAWQEGAAFEEWPEFYTFLKKIGE